jgi:predicted secreted protein
MGWAAGISLYVIIWWIVIFTVLPWGVQAVGSDEVAKGHASGAPRKPRILTKMAVTSLVAALIWGVFYLVYQLDLISFRQ